MPNPPKGLSATAVCAGLCIHTSVRVQLALLLLLVANCKNANFVLFSPKFKMCTWHKACGFALSLHLPLYLPLYLPLPLPLPLHLPVISEVTWKP